MLTLAIDTASDSCAVALWLGDGGGRLCAERERPMSRGHGEALFGMVTQVLDEAAVSVHDIARFAAVSGPGTFTGLRIGLAAIRGLALALDADALAVSAFELIAAADQEAHGECRPRIVAIDARRGELYVAVLDRNGSFAAPPALLTPRAAGERLTPERNLVIGSGAPALLLEAAARGLAAETRKIARPPARLLARLAATREPADFPPEPLYIRAPDAKTPASRPPNEPRS
jgi:tRNA threonylcarbamoyladenosine biosynthesis protein TsaB